MKEGFNLIIDLFRGTDGSDQNINMEEFLTFIKSPPFVNSEHISLMALKHDILTKKVVSDMKADFDSNTAEDLLEAGSRDDFLQEPIESYDFLDKCIANKLEFCIWETMVLFNNINNTSRGEPKRYHLCDVKLLLFTLGFDVVWEKYEEIEVEKRRILSNKRKKNEEANARKSLNKVTDAIEDNPAREETKHHSPNKRLDDDESGIFGRDDREDMHEDTIDNDEDDDIFDLLNDDTKPKKKIEEHKVKPSPKKIPNKPSKEDKDSADFIVGRKHYNEHIDPTNDQKTIKIKHIFEINVRQLKNVPILKMILKDLSRGNKQSQEKAENKYIQDIFVRYIFPLDDEQIVSDYLEYSPQSDKTMDYKVSMHSFHTYLLETDKSVKDSLNKCGESFTLSLSCLKENQDMNIGNIQMPIEDLVQLVNEYEGETGPENRQVKSSRILFLYGTRFSQREETLIGKMYVDFVYKRELVETTSNRAPGVSVSNDLYLQKEVYINRKCPLNGYLNINIGALSELKGCLENIEYLMSLYNDPDSRENMCDRTFLSTSHPEYNKRTENIDRKRALLRISKEGLNLGVVTSIFEETPELKERFGTNQTRTIFRSLNPDFEHEHEYRIKMDTPIYEHLKYRCAVFEVRHYFVDRKDDFLNLGKVEDTKSEKNSEFETEGRDYVTLGFAKVPLTNLITRSNGVDQNIAVLDQFKQQLGYLKLRLSLNYQSRKHIKLQKEPAEKPMEGKYFLGFSFVELISQNNKYLQSYSKDELKHLLFKFKWDGETHQVRYIPDEKIEELPLAITVYPIHKLHLINFELNDETFEKSATPIEIQIWTKLENKTRCMKDREELIGSVFIDIQTLIKNRSNLRLRNEAQSLINTHDGYYTVMANDTNTLKTDRLGISTYLIKQEFDGQKEQLESLFYKLHNQVRKAILDDYDLDLNGSIDITELRKVLEGCGFNDTNYDQVGKFIDYLELKNPDTLYYSPIMNVLPPFLKFVRRIDKEQIIEFMFKRLSSVDNYDNGFVENNMFRSILECEVNLKEKIVDNFVANLKPNQLDYNMISHTMKLKTDYLLLIRKLYGYLQHWGILNKGEEAAIAQPVKTEVPSHQLPEERRCCISVSIVGANNVKNPTNENSPPNTYVCFRSPFETEEVELRTPVVYKTIFPQWSYSHEIKGVSISETCTYLLNNPLEFEIYHKKMPNGGVYTNQESLLVGRAYVDASHLVKDPEDMVISGYYHIFKTPEDRHIDDYTQTMHITQGQLKIEIKVNKPLLGEFDIQDTEKRQHQIILKNLAKEETKQLDLKSEEIDENPLQRALKKARELRSRQKAADHDLTSQKLRKVSRSPDYKGLSKEENSDPNTDTDINELKVKRDLHFKELADITTKLKHSLSNNPRDDPFEEDKNQDDDFARATSQSLDQ